MESPEPQIIIGRNITPSEIEIISGGATPSNFIEYLGWLDLPEPKPSWDEYSRGSTRA